MDTKVKKLYLLAILAAVAAQPAFAAKLDIKAKGAQGPSSEAASATALTAMQSICKDGFHGTALNDTVKYGVNDEGATADPGTRYLVNGEMSCEIPNGK